MTKEEWDGKELGGNEVTKGNGMGWFGARGKTRWELRMRRRGRGSARERGRWIGGWR